MNANKEELIKKAEELARQANELSEQIKRLGTEHHDVNAPIKPKSAPKWVVDAAKASKKLRENRTLKS